MIEQPDFIGMHDVFGIMHDDGLEPDAASTFLRQHAAPVDVQAIGLRGRAGAVIQAQYDMGLIDGG